jgi:hypothetical protein
MVSNLPDRIKSELCRASVQVIRIDKNEKLYRRLQYLSYRPLSRTLSLCTIVIKYLRNLSKAKKACKVLVFLAYFNY